MTFRTKQYKSNLEKERQSAKYVFIKARRPLSSMYWNLKAVYPFIQIGC